MVGEAVGKKVAYLRTDLDCVVRWKTDEKGETRNDRVSWWQLLTAGPGPGHRRQSPSSLADILARVDGSFLKIQRQSTKKKKQKSRRNSHVCVTSCLNLQNVIWNLWDHSFLWDYLLLHNAWKWEMNGLSFTGKQLLFWVSQNQGRWVFPKAASPFFRPLTTDRSHFLQSRELQVPRKICFFVYNNSVFLVL